MTELRITRLLPRELRERREACAVAWLPLGTLEWHGKHLPLGVDGLIAEGLCLRAADQIGGVVFPPVYCGDHRGIIVEAIAAPGAWGTLSFDHREECCRELGVTVAGQAANAVRDDARIGAQSEQYVELVERAYWMGRAYGFSRIVAVPGHGGTIGPAQAAADRFNAKQSACHALSAFSAYIGDDPIGHANAWETSSIMHLHPELVRLDWLATDKPDEPTGVDGEHPKLATPERGEATMAGFVRRCRELLGEVPPTIRLADPDEDGVPADWAERVRAGTLSS
jgi:creatinine amidohydrolase